jgi:hypothetical protein
MRNFLWWLFFIKFINLWKENFYWLYFRRYFLLYWALLTFLLIYFCVNDSFHNSNRWSFMNNIFSLWFRNNSFISPVVIWNIYFSFLFELLIILSVFLYWSNIFVRILFISIWNNICTSLLIKPFNHINMWIREGLYFLLWCWRNLSNFDSFF